MSGRAWKVAVGVVAAGWRLFEEVRFRRQRPRDDRFVPPAEFRYGPGREPAPFVVSGVPLPRSVVDAALASIEDRLTRDGHELELLAGHARRTQPVYVEPSEPAPKCPECGAPVGAPCASWCTSRGRRHVTVVQALTNPYREPPCVEWPQRRGEAS